MDAELMTLAEVACWCRTGAPDDRPEVVAAALLRQIEGKP